MIVTIQIYMPPKGELPPITPIENVPPAYVTRATLPGGRHQLTNDQKCYTWVPGKDGGTLVENPDLEADEAAENH
jgi:hypothetical protein